YPPSARIDLRVVPCGSIEGSRRPPRSLPDRRPLEEGHVTYRGVGGRKDRSGRGLAPESKGRSGRRRSWGTSAPLYASRGGASPEREPEGASPSLLSLQPARAATRGSHQFHDRAPRRLAGSQDVDLRNREPARHLSELWR